MQTATTTNQSSWTDIKPRVHVGDQAKRSEALQQIDPKQLDQTITAVTDFLDEWLTYTSGSSNEQEKAARKTLVTNAVQEVALKQLDVASGKIDSKSESIDNLQADLAKEIITKINAQYGLKIKVSSENGKELVKKLQVPPAAIKSGEKTQTSSSSEETESVDETKEQTKVETDGDVSSTNPKQELKTFIDIVQGIPNLMKAMKDGDFKQIVNIASELELDNISDASLEQINDDPDVLKSAQNFINENLNKSPSEFKEALEAELVLLDDEKSKGVDLAVKFLMLNASGSAVFNQTLNINKSVNNSEREAIFQGIVDILKNNSEPETAKGFTALGQKKISEALAGFQDKLSKSKQTNSESKARESAREEFLDTIEEAYKNGEINKAELSILVNNLKEERLSENQEDPKSKKEKGMLDHIAPGLDLKITEEQVKTVGTVAAIGIAALFFIPGTGKIFSGLAGMAATLPQLAITLYKEWDDIQYRKEQRENFDAIKRSQNNSQAPSETVA